MKSRMIWLCMFAISTVAVANGGAFDEVNAWRRGAGLPTLTEDPAMTKFAQMKAEYRAARGLKNGHQGPPVPAGWTAGCGEATETWGWLTCATECDFRFCGAGVAVGVDGERYMVFVGRGGSGRALLNPNRYPIIRTAHLTPKPVDASSPATNSQRVVVMRPVIESATPKSKSAGKPATSANSNSSSALPSSSRPSSARPASAPVAKTRCPTCGRYH
ncbi:MAG: CAP domain-containing protein [Planctomycetota bacterium]